MKKNILLLLIIFFTACSQNIKNRLEDLGVLPRTPDNDYLSTFINFTKTHKYYDQFETKSIIKVTYFSDAFVKAYIRERQKFLKHDEFKHLADKEEQLKKTAIRFFVSIYTPDPSYSTLTGTKTIWNILLVNSKGEQLYPTSIKSANEPFQILNYYFPTIDTWDKPYFITFEIPKDYIKPKESLKLVFKSVFSYSEFLFQYE